MNTGYRDQLTRHATHGRPRGADQVHRAASARAERPGILSTPDPRQGRPLLRTAVAAFAVVVVALGAVAYVRTTSSSPSTLTGPPTLTASPWNEYDPREIEHLFATMDPNFGEISSEYLLVTLENRRSCRKLTLALTIARDVSDPTARDQAIDAIMDPQLDRLGQRTPTESRTQTMWQDLTAKLKAGDLASTERSLQDCADSLDFTDPS